jgi:acyl dehydratase
MRAVVIVPSRPSLFPGAQETASDLLLPLGDRPFVQHVVERLVSLGATRLTFVSEPLGRRWRELLGDGARWGCTFEFVSAAPSEVYKAVAGAAGEPGDVVWLAHADEAPTAPDGEIAGETSGILLRASDGSWSGWAVVTAGVLASLAGCADREAAAAVLDGRCRRIVCGEGLSMADYTAFLASQFALLQGGAAAAPLTGREVRPGIRMGRGAMAHPSVEFIAPVFIGDNVRIGAESRIGPNAVIGRGCVVERKCTVADAMVADSTYVGEGLELNHVLVDGSTIVNVELGAAIVIPDKFILSSVR